MVYLFRKRGNTQQQQPLVHASTERERSARETISDQIDHLLEDVLHEVEPVTQVLRDPLDGDEEDQRVVITGIGLVTPFGVGVEPFWEGVTNGQSAIRRVTLCEVRDMACQIAAEVPAFQPTEFLRAEDAQQMSRGSQFAVIAAQMALADALLEINEDNNTTAGTLIASSAMALYELDQMTSTLLEHGPDQVSSTALPLAFPHMPAAQVALQCGLQGPITALSTACAAGAQAIGEAAAIIQRGDADIMLAGGAEASISRIALAGFGAMGVLSTRNDDPAQAARPFDSQRDGFVIGEGAGVVVLERLTHARRRGATIYGELCGYATTCDAYHPTSPDPNGDGLAQALRRALHKADTDMQQVDYIHAHATGAPEGDIAETRAIKRVFGEYAWSVPISATKSMIGHLAGAASAVGAATGLLALRHQLIPPTINLKMPDPECDLDYVPLQARPAELQTILSNSFAFGGINTVLIFRQLTD